jgi:electron transfer flavoprotein beta subunit
MKIAVCIKQVPGTSKVEVDEKTGVLKREGIDSKINPYDLFALETALQLKETNGAEICAITMGPPQAEEILREAYMMGVDRGVLLTDRSFAGADVLATSHAISQGLLAAGPFDLIICGKQTTDGDTAQVGPEIAEFMGIPHVADVRKISELSDVSLTIESDLPHRVEVSEVRLPCLITVEKDIYQPRLPSFLLKMKTRERPLTRLTMNEMTDRDPKHYGLNGSPTQVQRIFPPEVRDSHERWEGCTDELAKRLYEKLTELKAV